MKKKTIAIIGESYIGTGKGLYPVELFKAINKINKKYNIKLFLRDKAPFNHKNVTKVKTLKTKVRVFAGLGYYIPLFFELRKDKSIDIIHAYDEKTNIVAGFLKKPVVVTEYDLFPITHNKFPFNYLFRILYRFLGKAKFIIVISNYVGGLISKEFPSLSEKIVPIHLGTDVKRFKPSSKKNKKQINIGILGNLDEELWNVFERILKEYGDKVKISLGGFIPKKFDVLKSYPGVDFKGYIKEEDLVKHYQEIDIFVYKTDREGFGLIPLEAMASGCVVVVSNVASLPEVVNKGGILIENSEKYFYNTIKKLIENESLRLNYSKKGRIWAKRFTWNTCAQEHLRIYKKVLKEE